MAEHSIDLQSSVWGFLKKLATGEPVVANARQNDIELPKSKKAPGNIDLYAQPKVQNPDGSTSTVDSSSYNLDGTEVLLPSVTPDGRHLRTPDEIVGEYRKTGRHLGMFDTPDEATAYAKRLHEDYANWKYNEKPIDVADVSSWDTVRRLALPNEPKVGPDPSPGLRLPDTDWLGNPRPAWTDDAAGSGHLSGLKAEQYKNRPLLPRGVVDAVNSFIRNKSREAEQRALKSGQDPSVLDAMGHGFEEGVGEAVMNMLSEASSPQGLAVLAAGEAPALIGKRIAAVADDLPALDRAIAAARELKATKQVGELLREKSMVGRRIASLEQLRSLVTSQKRAVGAVMSGAGIKEMLDAPTWVERFMGVAQAAGGAAMGLSGAQEAATFSPATEALREHARVSKATPVGASATDAAKQAAQRPVASAAVVSHVQPATPASEPAPAMTPRAALPPWEIRYAEQPKPGEGMEPYPSSTPPPPAPAPAGDGLTVSEEASPYAAEKPRVSPREAFEELQARPDYAKAKAGVDEVNATIQRKYNDAIQTEVASLREKLPPGVVSEAGLLAVARAKIGSDLHEQLKDEYAKRGEFEHEMLRLSNEHMSARAIPPEREDRPLHEAPNTPEFKAWFGGSKAVRPDGKPLVAFHGTRKDFDSFDTKIGVVHGRNDGMNATALGSWFAAPSVLEGNYDAGNAEAVANDFSGSPRRGANVKPVYLSIKNPAEFDGYDDLIEARDDAGGWKPLRSKLSSDGHDGVVVRNSMTDGDIDRDDWVAFEPTQIKSAIGNSGAFDTSNPSLVAEQSSPYGVTGNAQTKTPEFKAWSSKSKIVNSDGTLKRVFHGARENDENDDPISVFEGVDFWARSDHSSWLTSLGDWFTDDTEVANHFADSGSQGSVYPVYLSMRNPLDFNTYEDLEEDQQESGLSVQEYRQSLIKSGYDGIRILHSTTDTGTEREDYVPFAPTQIKSATGNSGQFDPSNPSIVAEDAPVYTSVGGHSDTRVSEDPAVERPVRDAGRVRGGARVLAEPDWSHPRYSGRAADGSLAGLPRRAGAYTASVFEPAVAVAEQYARDSGIPYVPPATYVKVDPDRARRIAAAFDAMPHAPQDPEVKASYDAMIDETLAQYEAILASGLRVEFIDGEDPYGRNPRAMTEDVRQNNHMWVFSTRDGFGSDDAFSPDNNPLLRETGYTISGKPALANDIFRVVHDYVGHVKEGVGFRADGEENAWRSHSGMYSPLARKAMTTETRGQNSWVNFGPHGNTNRTASPADTHYADQKIGLLPDWVVTDGALDDPTQTTLMKEAGGYEAPSWTQYPVAPDATAEQAVVADGPVLSERGGVSARRGGARLDAARPDRDAADQRGRPVRRGRGVDVVEEAPPLRPGSDLAKAVERQRRVKAAAQKALDDARSAFGDVSVSRREPPRPDALRPGSATLHGLGIRPDLVQRGFIDFRGRRARSVHDIAQIAQAVRDPQVETLRTVFVQKGKVVAVDSVSSRLPDSTYAFTMSKAQRVFTDHAVKTYGDNEREWPAAVVAQLRNLTKDSHARFLSEQKRRMDRVGADGYYLVHNHPSGNATPSFADKGLTTHRASAMPGFKGHVIIDSGEYAVINTKGNVSFHDIKDAGPDEKLTPLKPHEVLGTKVSSPDSIRDVADAVRQPGGVTIVYSTKNERGGDVSPIVRAVETVSKSFAMSDGFAGFVRNRKSQYGGMHAYVYADAGVADSAFVRKMHDLYASRQIADLVVPHTSLSRAHPNPHGSTPIRKTHRVNEASVGYETNDTDGTDLPSDVSEMLRQSLPPDGGFTYDPVSGLSPKTGFAVSTHKDIELTVPAAEFHKQPFKIVAQYVKDNREMLAKDRKHLGVWRNPDNDVVYLDVSTVVPDRGRAMRMAVRHNQEAYFDFRLMRSFKTNTGGASHGGQKADALVDWRKRTSAKR